ncbi:hypothetical protein HNP38_003097 [Chryseobacterium defluvii]|uniref:Lipopolysaccharide biosynthesis protein n=1 Tax=Chryseobacterium defluvii TaxID=160396 RepID=A0A840KEG6_9FLAO|nr:lipopolysaccharide biosynthesis protein [Chryseobacterium defluvii]MBB4807781.1 hypothetical protein [Chryseobacterium defluvii]
MTGLKDKKILFLSVSFFKYERAIAKRLTEWGAEVDFYDERPSNSNFSKGIIRFNKKLYQLQIHTYYKRILKEIQHRKYDYFLLIKGEAIPVFFLEEIKRNNPRMEMIHYNFDPLTEYPGLVANLKYFDKKFTFERSDAHTYHLHFRPLFYLEEYKDRGEVTSFEYDMVFIGSAHTDRYVVGEKVKAVADQLHLKCFFYYYAMGRAAFRLKKLIDKNLKQFDLRKVSFKKLSHQEIIAYYGKSKSVLDINKPFQEGLTIRTFEVLAAGRKLVTTNADIKNYPFYNPDNILIIDRENVSLKPDFFTTEFTKPDEKTLYMMSLDSFIECLFVEDQDQYWSLSHTSEK